MRSVIMSAIIGFWIMSAAACATAHEYHVAVTGDDTQVGSAERPLRTIQAAADLAQPGDVVTVHEGVYRERIDPPRGGSSDDKRITYQAAAGEKVVIKGSDVVKGWTKVTNDTWKVELPNSYFGDFNPYKDVIHGDWFNGKGRIHHTGAVYLKEHWLTETVNEQAVLAPAGDKPLWYTSNTAAATAGNYLLNVAWLTPNPDDARSVKMSADAFAAQRGVQTAPCSEGGQCVGYIEAGDWVRYDNVDLGERTEQVVIRAASVTAGGTVELRLDKPNGELLGTCVVTHTGDWQKWQTFTAKIKPTGGKRNLCLVFRGPDQPAAEADKTVIFAQFKGIDPNKVGVEITARQSVFYPSKTGINYITVRGFTMMHAATNWAPPTAEQVGLIGTHWSKGWIIENNDISYSMCSGVTLGKHGDEWDNRAESAEGYVGTIHRGTARGWSKQNIGSHVVRNNHISHCEQGGIIGSLGPVFSTITGNVIHDIAARNLVTGAEQAGIKLHGAIDVVIRQNHIYRCGAFGIWLDWMAQGTRVSRNLLHDNFGPDLFVEVDHGPFVVENNIFLSGRSLYCDSRGGAYAHNLMVGRVDVSHGEGRHTPYHKPHSTEVVGLHPCPSGDNRFYNNLFAGGTGLSPYDRAAWPMYMAGNVFFAGAKPSRHESDPVVLPAVNPGVKLVEKPDGVYLQLTVDPDSVKSQPRPIVTTDLMGKARVPDQAFEDRNGKPIRIDTDYFGHSRDVSDPMPGPFAKSETGNLTLKVWPIETTQQ